jgi:hypothetical protein
MIYKYFLLFSGLSFHSFDCVFLFFFFFGGTGVWTQGLMLATPPVLFCVGYFWDRVSFFCPGWPPTVVLLISAFWVAGITGVNHRHPTWSVLWHTEVFKFEKFILSNFYFVACVFGVTSKESFLNSVSWSFSSVLSYYYFYSLISYIQVFDPLWVNFCIWHKVRAQLHSFESGYVANSSVASNFGYQVASSSHLTSVQSNQGLPWGQCGWLLGCWSFA